MHLLFVLVLIVGTFLYFPRLAKVLVGLALTVVLVGALSLAGLIVHEEYSAKPAREAAATEKRAAEILQLYDTLKAWEPVSTSDGLQVYVDPATGSTIFVPDPTSLARPVLVHVDAKTGTPSVIPVPPPPPAARPRAARY